MIMTGWIKLHRILMTKPIWKKSTSAQKVILISLLLMANHEKTEWEWMGTSFNVAPGQFITSLESIKQVAGKGISIQNIRSCLARFKKLEFLTEKSTKNGRIITICNWECYQRQNESVQHRKQQRGNKEVTPIKKDKNEINSIIDYLNLKSVKDFKPNTIKTQNLIKARLSEGYSIIDFYKVIDVKTKQWKNDINMNKFLRPDTLFSNKFEGYLNEKTIDCIQQIEFGAPVGLKR